MKGARAASGLRIGNKARSELCSTGCFVRYFFFALFVHAILHSGAEGWALSHQFLQVVLESWVQQLRRRTVGRFLCACDIGGGGS